MCCFICLEGASPQSSHSQLSLFLLQVSAWKVTSLRRNFPCFPYSAFFPTLDLYYSLSLLLKEKASIMLCLFHLFLCYTVSSEKARVMSVLFTSVCSGIEYSRHSIHAWWTLWGLCCLLLLLTQSLGQETPMKITVWDNLDLKVPRKKPQRPPLNKNWRAQVDEIDSLP